ncbi:MAG: UrcA family protein [Sphingomicrobium sp.]
MREALSIICVTLLAIAGPLAAQPQAAPVIVLGEPDELLVDVPYGDLQLARQVDQLVLASRVKRANHRACVDIYSSWYDSAGMLCEHIAWQVARPQIERAIAESGAVKISSAKSIVVSFSR